MKFLLSSSLFFSMIINPTHIQAREIVIIENLASRLEGETLAQLIQKRLGLPKNYISVLTGPSKCTKQREAILHICLLSNGDIEIIKKNEEVLENLKNVFTAASEEVNESNQ